MEIPAAMEADVKEQPGSGTPMLSHSAFYSMRSWIGKILSKSNLWIEYIRLSENTT